MNLVVFLMRKLQHLANDRRIAKNADNYDARAYCNIPYLRDGSPAHVLDIYSPQTFQAKEDTALPVVLDIHGGAYTSCTKEFNRQQGLYFASRGWHCVNMEYTLMPEGDMKTVQREIFAVLEWILENADAYGFDTDRIYMTGDSAGGHFVLLAAAIQSHEALQKYYGIPKPLRQFRAFAANCPLADFSQLLEQKEPLFRVMKYTLKKQLRDPLYIENTDSRLFMDDAYPDVFILTTPEDTLLYSTARSLHEYMESHHVRHQYKEYHGSENKLEHVFSVTYPDYKESREANDDILRFFLS